MSLVLSGKHQFAYDIRLATKNLIIEYRAVHYVFYAALLLRVVLFATLSSH